MNLDRWCELGLPKKAFDLLNAVAPFAEDMSFFTFSVKRRFWGDYWTILVQGTFENEPGIEINYYSTAKKAENVLLLLALEGLKVKK